MIYIESAQMLAESVPPLTPKEPWACMEFATYSLNVGAYLGKINGRHHIVHRPTFQYHSETRNLQGQLTIAHEIAHQSQAEQIGQNNYWGFDFENEIANDPEFQAPDYNDQEAVEKWAIKLEKAIDQRAQPSFYLYVMEGMAYTAEHKILLDMIKNNNRKEEALQVYQKQREYYKKGLDTTNGWNPMQTFSRGLGMYRRLSATMDIDQLTQFMQKVDLVACRAIPKNSPDAEYLLRNPLFLPKKSNTQNH